MITTNQIIHYTNHLLEIEKYKDYCPNGLQVEGKKEIKTIVTGVSACQALIDAAIDLNADLLLVHHGYFWKNEAAEIVGMKRKRLATLLQHDLNLAAYHLPLDMHPELGNNIKLAELFEIEIIKAVDAGGAFNHLSFGKLLKPMLINQFMQLIAYKLGRTPLVIRASNETVNTVALCTGAAQDFIVDAIALKADVYVTGEVSERTIHIARENNINFIAAGHHATERYGIKALGEHLAKQFSLEHHFIDIDNPV